MDTKKIVQLILITFLFSVVTIKIGTVNVSFGDILLPFNFLFLLFAHSKSLLLKGKGKQQLFGVMTVLFLIIFFSVLSFINYFSYDFSIKNTLIEWMKLVIAVSYGGLAGILFFLFNNERDKQSFDRFFIYSALIVGIASIIGVVLYRIGMDNFFVMNGGRAKGTLSDTNITGIFFTAYIPLLLSRFDRYNKKGILFATAVSVAGLFATASKAAFLVFVLTILMITVLTFYSRNAKNIVMNILLLSILIGVFYFFIKETTLLDSLIERLEVFISGTTSEITTGRSDLWKYALSLIDSPRVFLIGIGYGTFGHFLSGEGVPYYLQGITLVHNTLLSMLVETGFFCFILLIFILVYLLCRYLIKIIKTKNIRVILTFIALINLIIGMNSVNLQNNRFLYILVVYFYFYVNDRFIQKESRNVRK